MPRPQPRTRESRASRFPPDRSRSRAVPVAHSLSTFDVRPSRISYRYENLSAFWSLAKPFPRRQYTPNFGNARADDDPMLMGGLQASPHLHESVMPLFADFDRGLAVKLGDGLCDRIARGLDGLIGVAVRATDRLRDNDVDHLELR